MSSNTCISGDRPAALIIFRRVDGTAAEVEAEIVEPVESNDATLPPPDNKPTYDFVFKKDDSPTEGAVYYRLRVPYHFPDQSDYWDYSSFPFRSYDNIAFLKDVVCEAYLHPVGDLFESGLGTVVILLLDPVRQQAISASLVFAHPGESMPAVSARMELFKVAEAKREEVLGTLFRDSRKYERSSLQVVSGVTSKRGRHPSQFVGVRATTYEFDRSGFLVDSGRGVGVGYQYSLQERGHQFDVRYLLSYQFVEVFGGPFMQGGGSEGTTVGVLVGGLLRLMPLLVIDARLSVGTPLGKFDLSPAFQPAGGLEWYW